MSSPVSGAGTPRTKGKAAEALVFFPEYPCWDNAEYALYCRFLTECYSFSLFSEPWILRGFFSSFPSRKGDRAAADEERSVSY